MKNPKEVKKPGNAPKDLNEFLQCLKIDVDFITWCRNEYEKIRYDPDAETMHIGHILLEESNSRTELYEFIKEFLPLFLKEENEKNIDS